MHVKLSQAFQKACEGDVDVDLLATVAGCNKDSQSTA